MVFVGDYIYEGTRARRRCPAACGRRDTDARGVPQPARPVQDRPDLQRLHAAVPWLVTWDDHEVDNNYAGTLAEALDPNSRARRAAAYQAYYEHMPLRRGRARAPPAWSCAPATTSGGWRASTCSTAASAGRRRLARRAVAAARG